MNIAENILSAIDILTDKKIAEAGFDRTVPATIVGIDNPVIGKYKVEYNGAKMFAYGAKGSSYNIGDQVYVLIPGNDVNQDKQILSKGGIGPEDQGKVDTSSSGIELDEKQYDFIGANILPSTELLVENASKSVVLYVKNKEENLINLSKNDLEEFFFYTQNEDASAIILKAQFKTGDAGINLDGDYGLRLSLILKDDQGSPYIRDYILSTTDMVGDPFKVLDWTTQLKAFDIPNLNNFMSIESIVLITDGLQDDETVSVQNIELYVGTNKVYSQKDTSLTILAPKGQFFGGSKLTLDLTPSFRYRGFRVPTTEFEYIWFQENPMIIEGDSRYSEEAGAGWDKILTDGSTLSVNLILTKSQRYKLLVKYKGTTYSAITTLYNQTTEAIDLRITEEEQEEIKEGITFLVCAPQNNNYLYQWRYEDSQGAIVSLKEDDYILQVTDIANIIDYRTYYCFVTDKDSGYIGYATYILENKDNEGYSIVIENGTQNFYYNERGELLSEVKDLIVHFFDPSGKELAGDELNNYSFYWQNTGESNLSMIESFSVNGQTVKLQLNSYYSGNKLNNTLIVIAKNKTTGTIKASATTKLSFVRTGDPGTNGTKYMCFLRLEEQKPISHLNVFLDSQIIVYAYYQNLDPQENESGNLIQLTANQVKWKLTKDGGFIEGSATEDGKAYFQVTSQGKEAFDLLLNSNFTPRVLTAQIKIGDITSYAFLPLVEYSYDQPVNPDLDDESGFYSVVYSSNKLNPVYKMNNPFKIKGNKWRVNLISGSNTIGNIVKIGQSYDKIKNITSIYIRPKEEFYQTNALDWLWLTQNPNTVDQRHVYIPIRCSLNKYEYAAINNWDGSSFVQKDGWVLSPIAGFGTKNEDNTFTGVVLGEATTYDGDNLQSRRGILGYSNGIESFVLNAEDGSARFGTSEAGSIEIIPAFGEKKQQAIIQGGGYKEDNSKGMCINLSKPSIEWGNGRFSVDQDGNMYAGNGTFSGSITGSTIQGSNIGIPIAPIDLEGNIDLSNSEVKFGVNKEGKMKAVDAEFSGYINASTINGSTINGSTINITNAKGQVVLQLTEASSDYAPAFYTNGFRINGNGSVEIKEAYLLNAITEDQVLHFYDGGITGFGYIDVSRITSTYGNISELTVEKINGETITATTTYQETGSIETSDERLKYDIVPLDEKYEAFYNDLQPITYKLKKGSSQRTHIGLGAGQVRDALIKYDISTREFAPYCSYYNDEGWLTCGLRYEEFISMNIYEIQKLKKRTTKLENKVQELENKLSQLLNNKEVESNE